MRRRVRSLGMMGRARKSGASSPLLRAAETTFHPQDVAEVSNGYFWDPYADAIGLGTADFRVREGNGHSTFDLVQATVANQPTVLTENGGAQFRMRKTGDAVGLSNLSTAGDVVAGWTGPTYIGMWLRLPDALGVLTSSTTQFFQHFNATGNQRRIVLGTSNNADNSLDRVTIVASVDGILNATSATYDTPFDGGVVGGPTAASYVWYEGVIDPALALGGSLAADKRKLFFNFVLQTQTIAPSIDTTSLFDASAPIVICSRPGGLGNGDTLDWAACYYANGIPSLANRVRLANHRNPTGVAFA
jgi:hypothetical protein